MIDELTAIITPYKLSRILVILAGIIIVIRASRYFTGDTHPRQAKERGRLIRKYTELAEIESDEKRTNVERFFLVFVTETGRQLTFIVGPEIYFSLTEGKQGYLSYKGASFISFK